MIERVYSTAEVAELEGLTVPVVSRECKAGNFPGAYRMGQRRGKWKIPESAIVRRREALAAVSASGLEAGAVGVEEYRGIAPYTPRARRRSRRAS